MAICCIKSFNYPDWRMRHRDFLCWAEDYESGNDDFHFMVMKGLADRQKVSLRSVNFPDLYLVHQGFRVQLKSRDSYGGNDELFEADATFEMVNPNNGTDKSGYMSFRSVNYPNHYLRHQCGELWLHENDDSELFNDDSTWKLKMKNKKVNIFSAGNFEDHAIKVEGDEAFIRPLEGDDDDFEFKVRPGNFWGQGFSFEMKHRKHHFLRHCGFRLRVDPFEDDELYRLDTTFVFDQVPDGACDEWGSVAITSVNYPEKHLRHKCFEMWLEEPSEPMDDFAFYVCKD